MKRIAFFFAWLVFGLLWSCREQTLPERKHSFYYTRAVWQPDSLEKSMAATGEALYVRFFRVDRIAGEVVPLEVMTGTAQADWQVPVLPVLSISDSVWLDMSRQEMILLAERVYASVGFMCKTFGFADVLSLHFDAEWTADTRNQYFEFLSYFSELTGLKLSITVPLHQLRDLQGKGLPPIVQINVPLYNTSADISPDRIPQELPIAQLEAALTALRACTFPIHFILPIEAWPGAEDGGATSALRTILEERLEGSYGIIYTPLDARWISRMP